VTRQLPARRRPSPARRVIAVLALAIPILAIAAFLLLRDDGAAQAKAAADAFAAAWSSGDDARAGGLTGDPAAAQVLKANRAGLDGAKVKVTAGPLKLDGDRATGQLRVSWQVPAIGTFAYAAPVTVVKGGDDWHVRFSPRTIHPRLTAATRLGTEASAADRANILDRDGHALVKARDVVRVGLQRDKVTDVDASATALAQALDLNAKALAKAVRGAGPKQFVEAQVLRQADYADKQAALGGIPGLLTVDATAPLAATREFGRALLGGVGPATAEQVTQSHGRLAPGAQTGQWGLEKVYDARLAGAPARRIVIRETTNGEPVRTLRKLPGTAPRTLHTTLSAAAQTAAEDALADTGQEAAVVALQPSTGDILAVANRPVDSTFDRALAGAYAPGSTFKVISTAALLRRGLDPSAVVECPQTKVVDGKTFKNFEGEESGAATFADDFAISCNTAFVSLAPRLPASALGTVARDYGLGRRYDLPVGVARSHVPPGTDAVSRAATMIGQDRITATPLALAGVAAAVQDGRWRRPRLTASDPSASGPALPAGELGTLRDLMRQVVTRGTAATAFAGVPGEVAGKTGTAEFGSGDPPPTHAWFIAYRGDLALAVLVENGRSGGTVAAPLAARFFRAYTGA
jgi:cell division protein FtsI/penicillin-binding protein 2/type II secretory pathway pseudopilin PulG